MGIFPVNPDVHKFTLVFLGEPVNIGAIDGYVRKIPTQLLENGGTSCSASYHKILSNKSIQSEEKKIMIVEPSKML